MDSLTQIVLGAGVAELAIGKKAGNHAILWGSIAGTLPDLDVIPAQWMSTVESLAFHRGFSHSIIFCLILAPILGWMVNRLYRGNRGNFREWTTAFFLCLLTHALLDCFTTWGVQLFWPLDMRIAWKSIFVIDPFYTLPYLACLLAVMTRARHSRTRRRLALGGLLISNAYLAFTVYNKGRVNAVFEKAFDDQELAIERYESRPTPFQNILWAVNAESEAAFFIGTYGLLDEDKEIQFHRFEKQQQWPEQVRQDPAVQKLIELTQGWYNLEQAGNKHWILNDYRFGQLGNYQSGKGEFVFSYEILISEDGQVQISERNTTASSDRQALLNSLWQRIVGREQLTHE